MFKKLIFILPVVIFFAGCKKSTDPGCPYTESNAVAPASEVATLQAYLSTNSIPAIQHSSGLFYDITSPGTGANASICSNVTVKYSGYLVSNGANNGTKFDENLTGVTFALGDLILGWQKGIPLVKSGGSITLYLPPSLAYGSNAVGTIPANSYLKFVIQVTNVQ